MCIRDRYVIFRYIANNDATSISDTRAKSAFRIGELLLLCPDVPDLLSSSLFNSVKALAQFRVLF